MTASELAASVRRSAGLFALEGRGLIEVGGTDRVAWLNGMVSNDVRTLAEGPERSGCFALLLTRKGCARWDFGHKNPARLVKST